MGLKPASKAQTEAVAAFMAGTGPRPPAGVIITSRPPHAYVRSGKGDEPIVRAAAALVEQDIEDAKAAGDVVVPPGSPLAPVKSAAKS